MPRAPILKTFVAVTENYKRLWDFGFIIIHIKKNGFFVFGSEYSVFIYNHYSISFSVKGMFGSQISKINFFNSTVKFSKVSFVIICDLFRLPTFSFTPNFKNPLPRFLNEIIPASALFIGIS